MVSIAAGICYRPPPQEEVVAEALILMGHLTTLISAEGMIQKGSSHLGDFLEHIDDNFLIQVTEDPKRKFELLDLLLTGKEERKEERKKEGKEKKRKDRTHKN